MTYRGRFAPSPTGPLHFGSLITALGSWLDARAAGGEWLVRLEDVDEARALPGAGGDILRTLEAYGLTWDGPVVRQRDRKALYAAAVERLRDLGWTYRCRCSRKEIADSGVRGLEGTVYPGTCRTLKLTEAVPGADRLRVGPGLLEFEDRLRGRLGHDVSAEIGDFVLRRRDGLFAYQLAVVVDDADQGVTDVVRGADLIWSTPRQVLLQHLLNLPTPRYLHLPVATKASGEKLSKHTHAPALDPAEAPRDLARAITYLGQETPELDTPGRMLAQARARWDASRIPPGVSSALPGRE